MAENDMLPLPGEFTDRGGNTGRLMTTPCATWKRRRARCHFSGGGDSGQHRAVKDEQNERPEPAAPAILSFLVRCQKDLVANSLLLPCRLPVFLG
jgi:hypothetical protein